MLQSKLESAVETSLNTASGFVLSWAIYVWVVIPYTQHMPVLEQAWWVTWLFTIVSLVRSYVWRRFFNAGVHKVVHAFLTRRFWL